MEPVVQQQATDGRLGGQLRSDFGNGEADLQDITNANRRNQEQSRYAVRVGAITGQ
jgi:hypothetical protein